MTRPRRGTPLIIILPPGYDIRRLLPWLLQDAFRQHCRMLANPHRGALFVYRRLSLASHIRNREDCQ